MPAGDPPPLGVILTAGAGTRLAPLTPALPKALVPLVDRPLLAYAMEALAALDIADVVVVVGAEDQATRAWVHRTAPATIAVQHRPRGPGDAVLAVGAALDGRPLVVWPVDTVLLGDDLRDQLDAFLASPAVAWLPLAETDRPREMGIAVRGPDDRITHLEEKPAQPRSTLAVSGPWLLRPAVVERLRTHPLVNARGELDLTGTIAQMLAEGADVRGRPSRAVWLDGGAAAGLLAAQRALLDAGRGGVAADATVRGCTITEPVAIGPGAHLEGCRLGPHVVVGAGARLQGVTAAAALVAPGARLRGGTYRGQLIDTAGRASEPLADPPP